MELSIHTGNVCYAFSIIIIFFISIAGGRPTKLLPRHTLEKFYHEMIQANKPTGEDVNYLATQDTYKRRLPFQRLFKQQYSADKLQTKGMATRVLIYSIASKGYLTLDRESVNGRGSRNSKDAIIIIESVGFNKVKLRGEQSKKYICFNEKGKLEGKENGDQPNCIFRQFQLMNHYTAFRSIGKQLKWIGIRPRGTVKKGRRTKRGQRSTKFLIIRL